MFDLSDEEIAILCESGESAAWTNYYLCAPPEFAKEYGVAVKNVGSIWVTTVPGMDTPFFNRIVGLGIGQPATEAMLDDAIGFLQQSGSKNYMAQVSPLAQTPEVTGWLGERGFVKGSNWVKLIRADAPAPAGKTDLRIEAIGREHAAAFSDVTLASFGMPPELHAFMSGHCARPGWHLYLGFDGDQPVAAAALYVKDSIGWLGFGSTLESHRKRGAQSAMLARRITDGLKLGCKWFVAETGQETPDQPNPSYHNMLRSGFQLTYVRPNYVHQAG